MKYEEFEKEVVKEVQKVIGRSGKVQLQSVRKLNNILRRGIFIERDGHNVSPTIYLNSFYEMLEDGMDMDDVVKKILEIYIRSLPQSKMNMDYFKDFEQVKHQIFYRLINRERNKELLEDIPHVDFLDLAICFYCNFRHPEIGDGAILIHNSHLEMWNVETEILMSLANDNTPQLMPAQLCTIDRALKGVFDEEELEELRQLQREKETYLYVLTNEKRCHGAAAILYPGVLKDAAKRLGGNFYVIPSSIHETLLLYDAGKSAGNDLHIMIEDINRSQLDDEEVLSDYAYFYNASFGRLIETH